MWTTLRRGQSVDEEGNGVVGLPDDQLLQQLLEQVVNVLLSQEILDLALIFQLLLLIHIKLYLYSIQAPVQSTSHNVDKIRWQMDDQCTLDRTSETPLSRFSGGWVMMNCSLFFMLLSYLATNLYRSSIFMRF